MSGTIVPFPSLSEPQIAIKEKYSRGTESFTSTSGPFKILLLGDASVGKTSLIRRLLDGKFEENYMATIGIDYKRKTVKLDEDRFVKLQIWDTAGQERFRGLAKNYYRGADAVILVYDVTAAKTFVDLPSWLEELQTFSLDERDILQVIVANKVDLALKRQVTTECGQALADKFKLDYIETSAKNGYNVELVFTLLAESLSLAHQNDKSATQKAQTKAKAIRLKNHPDAKLRNYKRNRAIHLDTFKEGPISNNRRSCDGNCVIC